MIPSSQSFVMNISHDCEPSSYEEATLNPAWQEAMAQGFNALHDNHTWDSSLATWQEAYWMQVGV